MLKFETSKSTKITAKGYLDKLVDGGIVIQDEKNGEDTLNWDLLEQFVGKKITITIANVEED